MLPVDDLSADRFLLFLSEGGVMKRSKLGEFLHPRVGGVIAAGLVVACASEDDGQTAELQAIVEQLEEQLTTAQGQLETRLDNVVYRLSFADCRRQARQLVCHGHFYVDGRKTDIPSYQVKPGNVISWKESHKDSPYIKAVMEDMPRRPVPEWLTLDVPNLTATVQRVPNGEELETTIDTRLIVEFYSR
ncbi:MAG: 30S ribosomal protein S4 [Armatimonadetes bacterium]|nr:30S ribosomal protein S4 [Armatimonadota bacterium]